MESLWQQTLSAYLDNPLPTVLKEKLFAYLSRYCAAPYCVVCHSCALMPLGLTAKQILTLLTEPADATTATLTQQFLAWGEHAEPGTQFPEAPEFVQGIYEAAIAIFVYPSQTEALRQALRRFLGNTSYAYLTLFLTYIRLCHQWIESYPELAYRADGRVQAYWAVLVQAEPTLIDFFAHYIEAVKEEQKQREAQLVAEIAKRKQAELALRKSEEQLRSILQNMPVMLGAFDEQNKMVLWNQECERVTGYSEAAMVVNPQAMTLLYPEATYRQHMIDQWEERGNDYRDWEWEMTCSDGSIKTVAWSNISDRFPVPGWKNWGVGVDVTDRKRAELALRNSEEQFRQVTETIREAFWMISTDQQLLYISPAYEEIWGRTCQSLHQNPRSFLEAIHPEDRERVLLEMAQQASKPCQTEYRISQPDGSIRWIWDQSFPVRNADGQIYRVVGAAQDITDRRQAETSLQESEAFFKLALDATNIGSWDWCPTTNKVLWNDNHFRLLGLVPNGVESSYQAWRDRVHLDDIERVEQAVAQALKNRTDYEAEYRVVHPDGSVHWLNGRGRGVYSESGQVIRMIGVVLDMTDRKRSEEALRESEERFRSLSACSPVGIYLANPDGYGLYTNPRCREIFGFTLGESIGEGWIARVHPDDREAVGKAWSTAAAAGETYAADYRIQLDAGVVRWVQTRTAPMRSQQGDLTGHVGTIEDITDRKLAEQEIQTLNRTLEQHNLELGALVEQRTAELLTLINTLPDYIFVVERDTMRMLFCNDLIARLISCESRQQVEGKTIFECFSPDLATSFVAQNQQVFDSGETLHFQESYTSALGTLNFDTYKIPLKKPNGEVYALIGTSRDITELVAARQKIADRTAQLEIVNRELESFSYSVSHDLRAPLRHIGGFVAALTTQLQQNGHLIDPKVVHYLQVIQDSSQKMGQLIDGLLTLSRLGRRQIAALPVDLNQLVATVRTQLPTELPLCGDATSTSSQPIQFLVGALPTVRGDATLLHQVFINLLDNAIKFSRQQPSIQIEIGSLTDGTLFVRDQGVGFQMEYADQLFGAFQRLHSQLEFEGTGIGLAIVQRIIHRHGGKIWAESQPHQGATFYFTLSDRASVPQQLSALE